MTQGDQGPLLLAVAGSLCVVALVSYAISDAGNIAERRNTLIRNRELLREQAERLVEERKALKADIERMTKERSLFTIQQDAIMKSLQRLERNSHAGGSGVGGAL